MYVIKPLTTWLGAILLLFTPALASGYGERTELSSPVEKTGQKALTVEMESTSPDQEVEQEVLGRVRISQRASGVVIQPALRVSSRDFEGRALVIHAQRDSYSGEEDSAGGSGDAIACGVADPG